MTAKQTCMDGNQAASHVAYRTNEVVAIYPITPASPMGEWSDLWSARGVRNLWGSVPRVVEMQSEGGAAGAVHGAIQGGALTTTFTASQGLLLMLPNMYKIAGELSPVVFHVAARTVATHALSIFGDHSDVMAARPTGWAMLCSDSVQQVMDFALIAQSATLRARLPFVHVFDGFRTSHEVQKIDVLSDDIIRSMIDENEVRAFRARSLSPDRPVVRGTAQNPDVFFQAREAVNPFYLAAPAIVQDTMDAFGKLTGRQYRLFEYEGAPDAERVIVVMGSGADTAGATAAHMHNAGEKVGVLKVRLFRPFSIADFVGSLPKTTRAIAVLDRTKEPGSTGEPLYQDVVAAITEATRAGTAPFAEAPDVIGGRYGLSSKEFTPAMVKGVFDELANETRKRHFTVGINDDVTHSSVAFDPTFDIEGDNVSRAVFWGLGSDGTVGANKNTIKIIGEQANRHAQGYFVYDSKKSGAKTVSHLRFSTEPIRAPYLIRQAQFVAVHQFGFLERFDTLAMAAPGATLLLNSPHGADTVWEALPHRVREQIIEKKLDVYVIDAYRTAREAGAGSRINTIMQTAFFSLSGVLPEEEAIEHVKKAIRATYGNRGESVVKLNYAAVDAARGAVQRVEVPAKTGAKSEVRAIVPDGVPEFIRDVTAEIMADRGDDLPVSALPPDGTFPSGTARYDKRDIALELPVWEPDLCIQCGKCVMVCPHSVIRAKLVEPKALKKAPNGFKTANARWNEAPDRVYTLQIATEDCTGCNLCAEICPAKDKSQVGRKALNMVERHGRDKAATDVWDFFEKLPDTPGTNGDRIDLDLNKVKNVQLVRPLFEFSSACAGCGETPYLKLMSQLFGDRAVVANATGCSSIYGGNLPTTPWSVNSDGRGPAWSNSLFEDNAEFGLGIRLAIDKQREYARELVAALTSEIGEKLAGDILGDVEPDAAGIDAQRERVAALKKKLDAVDDARARDLASIADTLVPRSVWIVGGDGWAYDIGFGGLDHVLASGHNVNLLVLDTEVYSNTGGQASKSTPLGAVAKFAAGGKRTAKKELGMIAMSYGHVYVAQVAIGANDVQALRAFREAESYDGPSLVIAYSQCIAHGIDMANGMEQQKLAAHTGYWPLYRYDPRIAAAGEPGLKLDSKAPSVPLENYMYNENRFRALKQADPETARALLAGARESVDNRRRRLEEIAGIRPKEA